MMWAAIIGRQGLNLAQDCSLMTSRSYPSLALAISATWFRAPGVKHYLNSPALPYCIYGAPADKINLTSAHAAANLEPIWLPQIAQYLVFIEVARARRFAEQLNQAISGVSQADARLSV